MARIITIYDDRKNGSKTRSYELPHPKPGEKANTMDLDVDDIFEKDGVLYRVTGLEGVSCTARPLDTTSWDGIEFLFMGDIVTYKGR